MSFDRTALLAGATVTMAVCIPVAAVGAVVLEEGSELVWFFAVLAVVGFLAGGYVAGRRQPETPMAHGAIAALLGFAVAQAIAAGLQVARDESVSIAAVVFNGLVAANIGLLGGRLGARSQPA